MLVRKGLICSCRVIKMSVLSSYAALVHMRFVTTIIIWKCYANVASRLPLTGESRYYLCTNLTTRISQTNRGQHIFKCLCINS